MPKKKSPEEELELVLKLQEDLKKRLVETKKKVKEEQQKKALKLTKQLIKVYNTTDLDELKEKIAQEIKPTIEDQLSLLSQDNAEYISLRTEEDINYLRNLASGLRQGNFVNYKDAFNEIKQRF